MRPFPSPRMRGLAGRCMHRPGQLMSHIARDRQRMRPGRLRVKRCLFLGRRKCPSGTRATLLAKLEAQLARRSQLGLDRAEGGTGLSEIQGAKQVATEKALIACDLACGSLALLRH
jgi:hypothetical protein